MFLILVTLSFCFLSFVSSGYLPVLALKVVQIAQTPRGGVENVKKTARGDGRVGDIGCATVVEECAILLNICCGMALFADVSFLSKCSNSDGRAVYAE